MGAAVGAAWAVAAGRSRAASRRRAAGNRRGTRRATDKPFSSPTSAKFDLIPGQPEENSSRRLLFAKQSELAAIRFQESLFTRYTRRYEPLPLGSPEYREELLRRLAASDVAWLEGEMRQLPPGSWDFIFPPASRDKAGGVSEGWCRSPLSLMVRPSEGFFSQSFLPEVGYEQRVELVRRALESGVCSPHCEGQYWSCPAIHASLAGDVRMLRELHRAGLDMLGLRVEWAVYDKAEFTVAHAAAINGHLEALAWMTETFETPDGLGWLDLPDAAGSTPLYYAVQTARSAEVARFLLGRGCNPFTRNAMTGRSPLSISIESLPELAKLFLETKTKPVYAWWGNPVIGYDFEGVAVDAQTTEGQLRFTSEGGSTISIEGLISLSGRPDLAAVPIINRLSDRKWEAWARERYYSVFASFLLLAAPYITEAMVGVDWDAFWQLTLLGACSVAWFSYTWIQILEFQSRGRGYLSYGWNIIDVIILVLVPLGAVPHIFDALDLQLDLVDLEPTLQPVAVVFDAFLLILMCVRLCRFLSVFSEVRLALYLNTVLDILTLSWKPLFFLAIVVASFALGFVLIFRPGPGKHPGYVDMIFKLLGWTFQPDEALSELMGIPLEVPGLALFLIYLCVAVLGSLRLVEDSVNVKRVASEEAADAQFQALRLEVIDDIEQQLLAGSEDGVAELHAFYKDLRNSSELLQLETRTELWPQRKRR